MDSVQLAARLEKAAHTISDAPPAARAAAPHRLEYIDGLRALAALWVVFHHAFETSPPLVVLGLPFIGPLVVSLSFGQFPVMIFLMLSGFCLYYPYVKKNPERPEFSTGFRTYLIRRATRIGPPYFWAGALCLVLAAFPQLQVGRWRDVGNVDAGVILSHLLFVHNLIPSHAAKIDYPMWSIGLEWQLYLLLPPLIWAFRKSNGPFVVGATLALAAVVHVVSHHLPGVVGAVLRDGPLAYLEIFCTGMVAAALTVRRQIVAPKWVLGSVAVAGFMAIRLGSGNGLAHDLAATAAAFSVLMLAVDAKGVVSRALSTPWLVRVGFFSYSVYLVHAPLMHLTWFWLRSRHLSADAMFLVLAVVCLPAMLAVSYGFHCLFERPFMRIRRTPTA